LRGPVSSRTEQSFLEVTVPEANEWESEIHEKAKEWRQEYGQEFLLELIDVYLEDTPARLASLQQAVATGDTAELIRQAHTLKSSSANVGAMELSVLAKALELAGRNGETTNLTAQSKRVAEVFHQVRQVLAALRAER
jgi:HPt (histidine-containing phosphotransfer) domain-containing protein